MREFDPADIPEEAYGGEDNNIASNISEMQEQNTDKAVIEAMRQFKNKMKNAYILIYERVEVFDMSKVNDVIDDLKSV